MLDEPFGALDPGITADMHEIVLRLWALNRMTIFMITHDLKGKLPARHALLVFDKPRHDPQAPEAYGATVTYDIPLNGGRRAALSPAPSAPLAELPASQARDGVLTPSAAPIP